MKITDLLFNNFKDDTAEAITATFPLLSGNKKINSRFPAGVGESTKRSTYAAPNRMTSAAKVSWAVGLVSAIINKKLSVAFFDTHLTVYMEYKTDSGDVYAATYSDKKLVKWLNNKKPDPQLKETEMCEIRLLPIFLWYYRYAVDNEFNGTLKKCINDCSLAKVTMSTENAALLCDSLYYGMKSIGIVDTEITVDELLLEELNQMVNSSSSEMKMDNQVHTNKFTFIVQNEEAEKSAEEDNDQLYREIQDGKYIIGYSWTDAQKAKIIPLSFLKTYVPNKHFFKLVKRMKQKLTKLVSALNNSVEEAYALMLQDRCIINAMYNGKAGCGKTTLVQAVSATFGLPFYSTTLNPHTEPDVFEGTTRVQEGGFAFFETPFLEAFTNGGIINVNEINLGNAGVVQGGLADALEAPYVVQKDGCHTVKRHPLCIFIATLNPNVAGSQEMNKPFVTRLRNEPMEEPTEEEYIKLLLSHNNNLKLCQRVYKIYKMILDRLNNDTDDAAAEYCELVTLRGCIDAMEDVENGIDFAEAIKDCLCGGISVYDMQMYESVCGLVDTI